MIFKSDLLGYQKSMKCPLCFHPSNSLLSLVFECPVCGLVFKSQELHLSTEDESRRYASHQNAASDEGYLAFLNRLITPLKNFLPKEYVAIDFGCGPGPVLASELKAQFYDPLFFPNEDLLSQKFDVVTSTEVVEHFKAPDQSWELLVSLVKPGGVLAVMTQLIKDVSSYNTWWYKNDPTHVVFYQEKTFDFISEKFGFDELYNDHHSVIILRKR